MYANNKQGLEELIQETEEYFKQNEMVSVQGLCEHLGITRKTLRAWQLKRGETWYNTIDYYKNRILAIKKQNAYHGLIDYKTLHFDLVSNYDYKPVSIKALKEKAKEQASKSKEEKEEKKNNQEEDIQSIFNDLF